MNITKKEYRNFVDSIVPKSEVLKNCCFAFLIGGSICMLSELLFSLYRFLQVEEGNSRMLASVTLIFFAALLTGIGIFDDIAKVAGAGTLVPITGFANAVAAPAIDFKSEGNILGTCVKMFTIAGPVIVYGTVASVVYGCIYYVTTLF